MSTPLNYIIENPKLYNYKCDPNVILPRTYFTARLNPTASSDDDNDANFAKKKIQQEWYPYVNSYYQYGEDYDAVSRVRHLLSEVHSDTSVNQQSDPIPVHYEKNKNSAFSTVTDCYGAKSAMHKFLRKKPACFIILGKPEIGEEDLGRFLALHWNSVFIHPEDLIREEIAAETRAGVCIEYNLRSGRSISIDVIMRLLQKKINEEAVKHRGFVLCGFPLVTNTLFEEDPVSSESAVFTVHDIFEEIFDAVVYDSKEAIKNVSIAGSVVGEGDDVYVELVNKIPEEETAGEDQYTVEQIIDKPKDLVSLDLFSEFQAQSHESVAIKSRSSKEICYESHKHDDHKKQMAFVFQLCEEHDCVLIYLKCENEEVVNLRKDNRIDALTFDHLNLQREKYFQMDESYGFINGRKYLKPQRDFPINVRAQLDAYRFEAQTVIEKRILMQNPQYFVKLDGRSPPERAFHSLKLRLRILPLSQSVIPEMLVDKDIDGDMESPKENLDDFTDMSPEEWFETLHKKKTIGKIFKLSLSDWEYTCPVSYTQGNPEFAVKFMNNIFFLAGEEECVKFRTNPRPYLLPPFAKDKEQHILIIGPPTSGKTSICEILAEMLNIVKLDPESMQRDFVAQKRSEMVNELKAKSVNEALAIMKQKLEEERADGIREFLTPIRRIIENYLACPAEHHEELPEFEMSSLPRPSGVSKPHDPTYCQEQIPEWEEQIKEFGLSVDDPVLLREALVNDEIFLPFIPKRILSPIDSAGELSIHHPFVEEYTARALEEYSIIPNDELLETYSEHDGFIQLLQLAEEYKLNGWIVDGFPPKPELFQSLLEDGVLGHQEDITILVLKDDTEDMEFLKTRAEGENTLRDCKLFFLKRDLEEIAEKIEDIDEEKKEPSYSYSFVDSEWTDESRRSMHMKSFVDVWDNVENFKEFLNECGNAYDEFIVSYKTIEELATDVVNYFESKHFEKPRVLSEEDRRLEREEFAPIGDEEADEEEEAHDDSFFQENRRLGASNKYCPYALSVCNVLCFGKEEFSARYGNETYLFSSAEALEAFVNNPKKILSIFEKQPTKLPPAKICVVGTWKIGKTSVSKYLADNFGLNYVNYDTLIRSDFKEVDYLDYIHSDVPLEEHRLLALLRTLWLNQQTGFVLDGFPKRPSDVLLMSKHLLIPDLIIELNCEEYALRERLMEILMNEWQTEMIRMKMQQEEENRRVYDEWKVLREKRLQELLLWKRDERYAARKRGKERVLQVEDLQYSEPTPVSIEEPPRGSQVVEEPQRKSGMLEEYHVSKLEMIEELDEVEHDDTNSLVSYRSVDEQEDLREIELILEDELPEPGFNDIWETEEIARERMDRDIDVFTNEETTFLAAVKDKCLDEVINWTTVDANNEERKVKLNCCQIVVPHKFKMTSIFERVYDVSMEMAERLLEQGYYFLSRFGKTCPVQMYDAYNYLQLFLAYENRFQLFSMIHKRYIYFIAGQESRVKFRENCLKYINQNYKDLPLIPIRISLTGPPKSGKSTITERLGYEYAFKIISIRKAVEHVLKFLSKSTLATKVEAELRTGANLNDELAIACVEAFSFEDKGVAVGFVMDGFPRSVYQVQLLAKLNMLPHVILDLNTDLKYIFTYMDVYPKTHRPEYSKKFIGHRYDAWFECQAAIRKWIDKEYQNVAVIKIDPSKWKFWKTSEKLLLAVISEIKYYYINKDDVRPLRIANLLVSPHEFLERKSRFRNYCPCCLYESNALTQGGNPPDRTDLFQYKEFYYWLCKKHVSNFLENPDMYLDNIPHSLPVTLPEIVFLSEYPVEPYEEGFCVICVEKGKPDRVFNEGVIDFAVRYGDTIYLFDARECLEEFLTQPGKFCSVTINFRGKAYPSLEMSSLPTMGFLEQFDANQVIKALTEVNSKRPVIIGLDVPTSALIFIGLCLKVRNPATAREHAEVFKSVLENVVLEKCLLKKSLLRIKQTINPYLHYQEPLPPFVFEGSKRNLSTIEERSTEHSLSEQGDGYRSSTTDIFPSLSDTTMGSVVGTALDVILENAMR